MNRFCFTMRHNHLVKSFETNFIINTNFLMHHRKESL